MIELDDENNLLIAGCHKKLGVVFDKKVHYIEVPQCNGDITSLYYDQSTHLLWFGSVDSYLRRISLAKIIIKL